MTPGVPAGPPVTPWRLFATISMISPNPKRHDGEVVPAEAKRGSPEQDPGEHRGHDGEGDDPEGIEDEGRLHRAARR